MRRSGTDTKTLLAEIFDALYAAYGPRRWWPVTAPGNTEPEYTGGPRTPAQRFEVAVGAVLTQNTAWSNAARAIVNLNKAGVLSPGALCELTDTELAGMIRPCGYFNQKARRLKILASFFRETEGITRERLLALGGIGPETADSIMLYAFNEPFFVVDAYTRRMFTRVGMLKGDMPYEGIRTLFEANLPRSVGIYQEYHALIVEHGKRVCRKKAHCTGCAIDKKCHKNM